MSIQSDGLSRRDLLRSAGLLGAVGAFAAVAGPLATTQASATTPIYQDNWRYCGACACLKYSNGTTFDGNCCNYNAGQVPAVNNGAHNAGSRNYYLYTSASGVSGQSGWKWCPDCGEIYWPSAGSHCPINGGAHDSGPRSGLGSYTYVMLYTELDNPNGGQSGWRYCDRCHALVWPSSVRTGTFQCPSPYYGGNHSITGYDYIIPYF